MIDVVTGGGEQGVEIGHVDGDGARDALPAVLPVLPLRETVPFPDTLTPLAVGQERSIRLVNDALAATARS